MVFRRGGGTGLSAEENATACAIWAACGLEGEGAYPATEDDVLHRHTLQGLCFMPEISNASEQRRIPQSGDQRRWAVEAREVIKTGANCASLYQLKRPRPSQITCEEAGCWWNDQSIPTPQVRCEGSVARLSFGDQTQERDCALAYQACDESSPTGCTDRAPVACQNPAADRCDGPIRVGCDGTGKVSYRDCSRIPGATCGDVGEGKLGCVIPNGGECKTGTATCDEDTLVACSFGREIRIECKALGFAGCKSGLCVVAP